MQRKHLYLVIVLIVAVVAALLITTITGTTGNALAAYDGQPAEPSVLALLQVPDSVSSGIGTGLAVSFPKKVESKPLTLNGKPEVLYIGANYCPFCASTRWSLIVALLRFGSFRGLEYMTSSGSDPVGPNTPTFTFENSTYNSSYISFVSVETSGNKEVDGTYPILQQPTAAQGAIFQKYGNGNIPFIDFANVSVQVGASYSDITIFAGKNWSTLAGMINNASTVQAQAVLGTANLFTAQICKIDNNTPQSVCGESYIAKIEKSLQ